MGKFFVYVFIIIIIYFGVAIFFPGWQWIVEWLVGNWCCVRPCPQRSCVKSECAVKLVQEIEKVFGQKERRKKFNSISPDEHEPMPKPNIAHTLPRRSRPRTPPKMYQN